MQNPEDIEVLRSLHVPEAKLHLLGNGVDLTRFALDRHAAARARVRAEFAIDDTALVVGAVGRLVLEKGYEELFEAWTEVRAAHPHAVLVIVGPDDREKADALPRSVIERAAAQGVRFLGMRDDVEDLYHAMDLYVLASHREGFPRSAMEAAACGLPIIATDIRGCRQVVEHGETGLLVEVRSAVSLREALADLLSDDARRATMSTAAAIRARERFDQQRVIDLTLDTYRRLCDLSDGSRHGSRRKAANR